MFEKFLRDGWTTFQQRYEGTYGFYQKPDGSRLLVKLERVTERMCEFIDIRGINYHINADADENVGFLFLPPKARFYNTDIGTLLVKRIAQRQFQRGITHRNTMIQMVSNHGLFQIDTNFANLNQIFGRENDKVDFDAFLKKHGAVALSGQIAITNRKYVYLYERAIGKYEKTENGFKVALDDPALFRTEVTDAFKANNFSVEIN